MKHYDAIVIGAGVGGLASALLLAHSGKKVALFEKRFTPGGRIGSTKRDDFTVDFGVHLISRGQNGPLIKLLERCAARTASSSRRFAPYRAPTGRASVSRTTSRGAFPTRISRQSCAWSPT